MPKPHSGASQSVTSLSLLARLREDPRRHYAWDEFIQRYVPKIHGWCRQWGLQEADAQDVTQDVLLQLAKQMHKFEYDPQGRFRSWLKTVTRRALADFSKARARNPARPGSEAMLNQLDSVQAKDDLVRRLDEEAGREQLQIAMDRVRNRVQPNTFEAFRLMTFEHLSGTEVAERLDMQVGSVFVAKSRIDRMLSEEVKRLDGGGDGIDAQP